MRDINAMMDAGGGVTGFDWITYTESDIKGWTVEDKINAGLLAEDGSDTDKDGLSDKAEIEIYKSDPLRKSTAGDFYTDGYKAKNNMDIFQQYEYEGDLTVKGNECKEISFPVNNADDLDVSVWDETNLERLHRRNTIKTYSIYKYGGDEISIDLSKLSNEQISSDNIAVYIEDLDRTEDIKRIDFRALGDIITIPYNFDMSSYTIYLTKKPSMPFADFFFPPASIIDVMRE